MKKEKNKRIFREQKETKQKREKRIEKIKKGDSKTKQKYIHYGVKKKQKETRRKRRDTSGGEEKETTKKVDRQDRKLRDQKENREI